MKNFISGKICSIFDESNQNVIGKMKDEYGGVIIN